MIASDRHTCARVSIVVLTHNRQDEVCAALGRLTRLSTSCGRPPIVVVDNASTDETVRRVAHQYPHVELIVAADNLGAAGRNLGVQAVRTPYVAFSDDDTAWAPTALQTAVEILDAHPSIAVLNAQILVGDANRVDPACDAMAASPLAAVETVGPELIGFMAGACVMRTESFRQAGGYWPPLFIGGEEALLALDIMDQGLRIVYAPSVVTHHWPSLRRDVVRRRDLTARNAIWTAWLRLPAPLAWRRSAETLKQAGTARDRWRLLASAARGAWMIGRQRRSVSAQALEKIRRVRRG